MFDASKLSFKVQGKGHRRKHLKLTPKGKCKNIKYLQENIVHTDNGIQALKATKDAKMGEFL